MFKGRWNQLAHLFSMVAIKEVKGGKEAHGEVLLTVSSPHDQSD